MNNGIKMITTELSRKIKVLYFLSICCVVYIHTYNALPKLLTPNSWIECK